MEEGQNPLVSVLMTAYNREKYIAESIESVLASTYINFELIIVDDRSLDNTLSIAKDYEKKDRRVRVYLNEENLQDYPNRNKAATYARGKYLKYLDSDDTIYPEGLAYCVAEMEKFPEASIGLNMIDGVEIPASVLCESEDVIRKQYFVSNHLTAGPTGMIIKRALFEKLHGFDTRFRMASDYFFTIKVATQSPVVLLKKRFFFYRMHEAQEQNNPKGYLVYGYLANKEILDTLPLRFDQKEIAFLYKKIYRQHAVALVKLLMKGNVRDFVSVAKQTNFGLAKLIKGLFYSQ